LSEAETTPPLKQNLFQLCSIAEVYGLFLDQREGVQNDWDYQYGMETT
jgi:hypothetical protein